jgi:hypothetical protein
LKEAAAIGFNHFWDALAGGSFHQAVLAVFAAQAEYLNAAICGGTAGDGQANDCPRADNVHSGEKNQQAQDQSGEVPDVLRTQAMKLDAFVDAFIDVIDAVVHGFDIEMIFLE